MGGRFAFTTALPGFGLEGVIGFYGYPDVLNGAPGPTQMAGELAAPVLALWGGGDESIPPAVVAAFGGASPHAFFDRKVVGRADACADAWARVTAFIESYRPTSEEA
ncbi:dienelactone hydrolase family protein [Spongiactinospora sp. 9N601]|uniref:dienelactone hydrolase family protein n=1 Tax=Spongiactinospora sp. 9N601 TaxID=3375149 RepID=UPI0037BB4655